jgi:hypothetical protein
LRGAAVYGLGTTINYLQRTTSAAAGSSLGTTINYLRRTTSGTAGNSPNTTIKYLRRTTGGAAGICRAKRSSTCSAQRAALRGTESAPQY